jgi:predicted hotdog family 3-hydroxylacyl-ACP dehydratase
MLLVEAIVEAEPGRAVTRATVNDRWPLYVAGRVRPLVLVELVAQSAAVSFGMDRLASGGPAGEKSGFLVGIREARFFIEALAVGDTVVTRVRDGFVMQAYREIIGTAHLGRHLAAEVTLQVIQTGDPEDISQ